MECGWDNVNWAKEEEVAIDVAVRALLAFNESSSIFRQ